LAAEEAVKKEVDRQEAKIKAEARQLQIERANKMLYDETDKVKSFHSALLLSDVLKEREHQIAYKGAVQTIKKKHEVGLCTLHAADPELASACFQPLKPECAVLVSKFALKCNVYPLPRGCLREGAGARAGGCRDGGVEEDGGAAHQGAAEPRRGAGAVGRSEGGGFVQLLHSELDP
jgi:hypothetical protein